MCISLMSISILYNKTLNLCRGFFSYFPMTYKVQTRHEVSSAPKIDSIRIRWKRFSLRISKRIVAHQFSAYSKSCSYFNQYNFKFRKRGYTLYNVSFLLPTSTDQFCIVIYCTSHNAFSRCFTINSQSLFITLGNKSAKAMCIYIYIYVYTYI